MSTNNRVQTVYASRINLLDILETLGYDVEPYAGFSVNEIDERMKTMQLDMNLRKPSGEAVYVKYLCGNKAPTKGLNAKVLDFIIDDLYTNSRTLDKTDTLILIIDGEPNDSMLDRFRYLHDHDGYFVVCHNIARLQFNILKHEKVPKSEVATDSEIKDVMTRFNMTTRKQFPEIGRFDPVSLALCLRPGQICKIHRPTPTAGTSLFYRVCV
jgi:DNA-directed RNA polymerase subunit H (RpoH/RPB5)